MVKLFTQNNFILKGVIVVNQNPNAGIVHILKIIFSPKVIVTLALIDTGHV
jgi:hypothetical protein